MVAVAGGGGGVAGAREKEFRLRPSLLLKKRKRRFGRSNLSCCRLGLRGQGTWKWNME